MKEMQQQHARKHFLPIAVAELTRREEERAQEASMCISEKHNGAAKGCMAHNGKPTQDWLSKEDTLSPTVGLDSSFFTLAMDAKER